MSCKSQWDGRLCLYKDGELAEYFMEHRKALRAIAKGILGKDEAVVIVGSEDTRISVWSFYDQCC